MASSASAASLLTIARTLGLSVATVSNAFNRPDRVGEATLARVLDEARRVGYAGPDPAARQLRRGRADAIGLVLTDALPFAFEDHAAVGFLAGVAEACEESGRSLVMLPSGASTTGGIMPLGSVALDGVIVYSVADGDPLLRAAADRHLPVVVVDQPGPSNAWDWVGIDNVAVGAAVAHHLVGLRHTRVGILAPRLGGERRNGPPAPGTGIEYAVLRDRIRGFATAFEPARTAGSIPVEERTQSAEQAGAAGIDALLQRHPDLTAVFCLSDELALGALSRLSERGVDVPRELSVVGVDDIERADAVGLTTVAQPLHAKGAAAGRQLIARIDERLAGASPATGARRILPTTMQVRRTTAPPRR